MRTGAIALYEEALHGQAAPLILRTADGRALPLQVSRWCGRPDGADEELLRLCLGPVLDVGCGPGRLTIALTERGIPALGVDISRAAVARVRRAGASALHRSVFDPLPGQGRWATVLLADGNIGIGGIFAQEAELFLESQVRENHSVVDLLDADYTFVNERLARHYGIPNIYGSHFRRVTLTDENRKGLLGKGAILLVTSYADRTSPVLRGKWVLDNILASPPPPPPPNVPALKENTAGSKLLTVRERMEEHRANAACAVCHVRMDPLGFALENFDAIGRWQIMRDGTPIDSMGSLPEGAKFQSVGGLRELLLSRREQFAGAVTEKMLAWALGRSVEYYDNPAVRKIAREAAAGDYRWSAIIEGIVMSTPFQMSSVRSTPNQTRRADP